MCVTRTGEKTVSLGISAPESILILRAELLRPGVLCSQSVRVISMARLTGGWSALTSEVSASWTWTLRAYQRLPTSAVSFIPRLDRSSFDLLRRSQG
ncbi:hypothetical protein ACEOPL_12270 [Pseudomonas aeruginosa]|nr:hypothetical protein [Pseudomonas aeruginosa]